MIIALVSIAIAAPCVSAEDTLKSFKPRAADVEWGEPGGWDKSRFRGMEKDTKKLFKKHRSSFESYPSDAQDAILAGELRSDLDEVAMYLSWRSPTFVLPNEEKGCRRLLYTEHSPGAVAATCDGAVTELHQLEAPLHCERLDQVLPRLDSAKRKIDGWSAEQQVQVLYGVPATWMDRNALELAFGKPEKKRKGGSELRFTADSGIHEGPTVFLVDGLADSWTFPATDVLNKEGRKLERRGGEERVAEARNKGGLLRLMTSVATISAAAAIEASAEGAPPSKTYSSGSSSYNNHQRMTCNGKVLYDKTFTSEATCRAAQAANTYDCNGVTLKLRC